ncbi:MAG: cytochrome c [Candidatus Eiseniibacteriota bacterium]|nr:MAG: cytochrome c [Candidatus Eisenbacteria bacterium]
MSLLVKSVLALVLFGIGLAGAACMLALMGKAERRMSAVALKRLHKVCGVIFFVLLLVISYFCLGYVKAGGDELSLRAVFHSVLALSLFALLVLKVSIVRSYREFMRFVPSLGLTVLVLSFLVVSTSAGFFFLGAGRSRPSALSDGSAAVPESADVEKGAELFSHNCSFCHDADSEEAKLGPGLKGLLERENLPFSGKPATPENVRTQLVNPARNMPSFASTLSDEDVGHLLAFLGTL